MSNIGKIGYLTVAVLFCDSEIVDTSHNCSTECFPCQWNLCLDLWYGWLAQRPALNAANMDLSLVMECMEVLRCVPNHVTIGTQGQAHL